MTDDRNLCNDIPLETPIIEQGVLGPREQEGFLLRAPSSEELAWDIDAEVLSARKEWLEPHNAWWIASSYLETVIAIVLRSFPSVLLIGNGEDRLISRDGTRLLQGRLL